MLFRVVAVLACAAYGAAMHCAKCVRTIEDYQLNTAAVCYNTEAHGTQCQYKNPAQVALTCNYNDNGESTGPSPCPAKVDIADCQLCKN